MGRFDGFKTYRSLGQLEDGEYVGGRTLGLLAARGVLIRRLRGVVEVEGGLTLYGLKAGSVEIDNGSAVLGVGVEVNYLGLSFDGRLRASAADDAPAPSSALGGEIKISATPPGRAGRWTTTARTSASSAADGARAYGWRPPAGFGFGRAPRGARRVRCGELARAWSGRGPGAPGAAARRGRPGRPARRRRKR